MMVLSTVVFLASYLIQIVEELQDSQETSSDEQPHLPPDISCKGGTRARQEPRSAHRAMPRLLQPPSPSLQDCFHCSWFCCRDRFWFFNLFFVPSISLFHVDLHLLAIVVPSPPSKSEPIIPFFLEKQYGTECGNGKRLPLSPSLALYLSAQERKHEVGSNACGPTWCRRRRSAMP